MYKFLLAAIAAVLAMTTVSASAEARVSTYRSDGWHVMASDQIGASRTLVDSSPRVTSVAIFLQKKAGPTNCRATVTVTKNGHVWRWRNLQKWARTYTRYGIWRLTPDTTDRSVNVRVNTNGRCIVGVAIR